MTKKLKLVLGSGSPRRQDILTSLGFDFELCIPDIEETSSLMDPRKVCEDIARQKYEAVCDQLDDKNAVVITGDTMVCFDNKIFGKPLDKKEAFETIKQLSGKTHQVISSICVGFSDLSEVLVNSSITDVSFLDLSEKSIEHYLSTKHLWIKLAHTEFKIRTVISYHK